MTDPSPSEFVAAYELSRYQPDAVLRLIKAAREWRDWPFESAALRSAVDALGEGEDHLAKTAREPKDD